MYVVLCMDISYLNREFVIQASSLQILKADSRKMFQKVVCLSYTVRLFAHLSVEICARLWFYAAYKGSLLPKFWESPLVAEYEADSMSRNVRQKLPFYVAQNPTKGHRSNLHGGRSLKSTLSC